MPGFSRKFPVEGEITQVGGKSLYLKVWSAVHAAQTRVGVGMGRGSPPSHWGVRGAEKCISVHFEQAGKAF